MYITLCFNYYHINAITGGKKWNEFPSIIQLPVVFNTLLSIQNIWKKKIECLYDMETFFCAYGLGYKIIYIHGILKDLLPFILFSYLQYRYKSRLRVNEKKYIIMYEYEYVNWQTNHCGVFFLLLCYSFFYVKIILERGGVGRWWWFKDKVWK